jgi:hypothetical protein
MRGTADDAALLSVAHLLALLKVVVFVHLAIDAPGTEHVFLVFFPFCQVAGPEVQVLQVRLPGT